MIKRFTPAVLKSTSSATFGGGVACRSLLSGLFKRFNGQEKSVRTRKAFTLAEVLITLGIIGVVSAMTIPTLINKCQKVILANQAKKEYAMWTQVFKSILADNNTTSLSETELWGQIEVIVTEASNPTIKNTAFWTELGKYVKISPSKTEEIEAYRDGDDGRDRSAVGYHIYLPGGSKLIFYSLDKTPTRRTDAVCSKIKELGGSMCSRVGYIEIDVNGDKGPNVSGRDIFEFCISDEGVLYPEGGKDYALYYSQKDLASNSYYWKNIYADEYPFGYYRAGQLMEEGWKMTY